MKKSQKNHSGGQKRDKKGRFKTSIFQKNKNEIIWNLINCGLAGGLVFIGSMTDGKITWTGVLAGIVAALIVIFTKFKHYWEKEEKEYINKLFTFIN